MEGPVAGASQRQKSGTTASHAFPMGRGSYGFFHLRSPCSQKNPKKFEKSKMAEPKYLRSRTNIKELSLSGLWVGIEPYTKVMRGLVKGFRNVLNHLKFSCFQSPPSSPPPLPTSPSRSLPCKNSYLKTRDTKLKARV